MAFMDLVLCLLALLLGLCLGAAIAWLLAKSRSTQPLAEIADMNARLQERTAQVAQLQTQITDQKQELEQSRTDVSRLKQSEARLAADLENERRSTAEKLHVLAQAERSLREAFQALSAEALKSNNQSFLELAKTALQEHQKTAAHDLEKRQTAIDGLVKPIAESLQKVEAKLLEVENERTHANATLTERLTNLATTQQSLYSETANLVKALRAPTVRGRWGEIQLRRVVEIAGMLEHCDFFEQVSTTTEEGRLKPDLLVRLPGGKNVIVDSKTSLVAYLESVEAADDEARENLLREHARQVRTHVTQLASKSYWDQFQPAPEFVIMFLPGEPFFSTALNYDPSLIEFGVEQRVILATPTTLIALLRAVAYGWNQEKIAANAQAICELGKTLYNRIQVMTGHFEDLRKGLNTAVTAHNKAIGSLEHRVLVTARQFKNLGVVGAREIAEVSVIDQTPVTLQASDLAMLPSALSDDSSVDISNLDRLTPPAETSTEIGHERVAVSARYARRPQVQITGAPPHTPGFTEASSAHRPSAT
jgi:DNA recombination protein RmuC